MKCLPTCQVWSNASIMLFQLTPTQTQQSKGHLKRPRARCSHSPILLLTPTYDHQGSVSFPWTGWVGQELNLWFFEQRLTALPLHCGPSEGDLHLSEATRRKWSYFSITCSWIWSWEAVLLWLILPVCAVSYIVCSHCPKYIKSGAVLDRTVNNDQLYQLIVMIYLWKVTFFFIQLFVQLQYSSEQASSLFQYGVQLYVSS